MGSSALAAAVPYPGKAVCISCKGQWSNKIEKIITKRKEKNNNYEELSEIKIIIFLINHKTMFLCLYYSGVDLYIEVFG